MFYELIIIRKVLEMLAVLNGINKIEISCGKLQLYVVVQKKTGVPE